ncbi:MAG: hypothetical protein PVS2B2_09790 [Candidatus Acidiferrum sp.]
MRETEEREILDTRVLTCSQETVRLPLPPKNAFEWQTQELMRKTGAEVRWEETEKLESRGGIPRAVCKNIKGKDL